MKLLAVAVFLTVAACGSATEPRAATSPSASTSAHSTVLFAVATGLPGAQLAGEYVHGGQATVSILDATGHVLAGASFQPPPEPALCPCRGLLQSPVRTAAGAVFYADSTGAVRMLKPDGSTSVVATFPLTNAQQELSYAVSPDGAHLIAIVISTPPLHQPPPQTLGDPLFQAGGHWTLRLETADAGGSTTTTLQRDLGTAFPNPTEIVGWDRNGPLATLTTQMGAQQAPPSGHLFGTLIHLAPDGTHLDALGGTDCAAVDNLFDGTVVCEADWWRFSVRSSTGAILWHAGLPSDNYYNGLWLSPDANSIAVQNLVITRNSVASAARQTNDGESQLTALGWLDTNTVVEADSRSGQLSLYEARGLIKIRDLGFSGIFEGLL